MTNEQLMDRIAFLECYCGELQEKIAKLKKGLSESIDGNVHVRLNISQFGRSSQQAIIVTKEAAQHGGADVLLQATSDMVSRAILKWHHRGA